jgi:hypothetical protein
MFFNFHTKLCNANSAKGIITPAERSTILGEEQQRKHNFIASFPCRSMSVELYSYFKRPSKAILFSFFSFLVQQISSRDFFHSKEFYGAEEGPSSHLRPSPFAYHTKI